MSDSCGVWHAVQSPAAAGPCMCASPALSSWQATQRSFCGDVRSFGSFEECGSWQVVHAPSFTGGCTSLFVPNASWQLEQSSGGSEVSLNVFFPFWGCGVAVDS